MADSRHEDYTVGAAPIGSVNAASCPTRTG
jgi:hypothetical protein